MSGGSFDYKEYNIQYIIDEIEDVIFKNKVEITEEDRRNNPYNYYDEQKYHYNYSDETINEFKKAVDILKKAQIYAHRIDYLLAGDDNEESFLKRLHMDLEKLNKENDE